MLAINIGKTKGKLINNSVPCRTAGIEDEEGKHKWYMDFIMINKQVVIANL